MLEKKLREIIILIFLFLLQTKNILHIKRDYRDSCSNGDNNNNIEYYRKNNNNQKVKKNNNDNRKSDKSLNKADSNYITKNIN